MFSIDYLKFYNQNSISKGAKNKIDTLINVL